MSKLKYLVLIMLLITYSCATEADPVEEEVQETEEIVEVAPEPVVEETPIIETVEEPVVV